MKTDKKIGEQIQEIRNLLNNFLQDVDTEARVDADVANAIVDIYLKKLTNLLNTEVQKQVRGFWKFMSEKYTCGGEKDPDNFGKIHPVETLLDRDDPDNYLQSLDKGE